MNKELALEYQIEDLEKTIKQEEERQEGKTYWYTDEVKREYQKLMNMRKELAVLRERYANEIAEELKLKQNQAKKKYTAAS